MTMENITAGYATSNSALSDYNSTTDFNHSTQNASTKTTTETKTPLEDDLFEGTKTIVLYVCIGLLGVSANIFAIAILSVSSAMRKKLVNVFLINQSAIDLVASLLLLTVGNLKSDTVIVSFSGIAADLYCRLIGSGLLLWSMLTSSTWNLVFVNLERYISVAFPIFHKTSFAKWHTGVMIACIWLFGPTWEFLLTFLTSGFRDGKCLKSEIWPSDSLAVLGGVLNILVEFFAPLLILIFCYTFMLKSIRTKVGASSQIPQNKTLTKNKNVIKTLAVVTIVFIICWLPYSAIYFNYKIGNAETLSGTFYHISVYLVAINCCLNPIIYSAQYKDFQLQMKRIFRGNSVSEISH